jgi:diguanylate cyclase (GGDEF)-like protein
VQVVKTLLVFLLAVIGARAARAEHTSLRVVSDDNYPPYVFRGPDHQPRGYLVDEWKLWEKKTGIHVDLIATDWADAQRMLLSGQADVIEMLFDTPDRERLYDFTAPYAKVTVAIYADSSISGIDGVDALQGFEVGTEKGDACNERLQGDGITSIRTFRGYTEMISAVDKREVRILCMDDLPANYYLYQMHIRRGFTRAFEYYSGDFHRGVRKGDLQTAALVDRGMALITRSERDALKQKWMGHPVSFTPYAQFFAYALLLVGLAGVALIIWVVTLRRAVERRTKDLGFLAYHDALTKLPNRYLLIDRIDHVIGHENAPRLAVFLIGLDHFKRVNESLGHVAGDALLKEVAVRLGGIEQIHTLARIGGDAFVATMQGAIETPTITAMADKLLRLIAKDFTWDGKHVFARASIGIALYPDDGQDGAALLKHADAALGLAKREGRGRFRFYRASLTQEAKELLDMGAGLRRALQRDEFLLLYQPQVDIETGRVVGVEALLRWQSGELGLVGPDKFIPYAEEMGLIGSIGDWVLQTSCHQLAQWLRAGLPALRMAVNLSPRQFASPRLIENITDALGASRIPPELLELEITEGSLLERSVAVSNVLSSLRALGVSLAIDDFGTGYSSLAYLHRLPIQLLKIDRTFLSGLPLDAGAVALTSTIIAMARNLNTKVLAEGVENLAQWTFLKEAGCDYAQGWHVGVPMLAADLAAWLRERARSAVAPS